jgi:hypothetical protein
MKLKNISNKLINVGETAILPDETAEVSGFDGNPVVGAMVEAGHLRIIESTAQDDTKTGQNQQGQTQEHDEEKKPLSRLNKAELLEECQKLGIETTEDDTRETLVEKIKAKTAE